MNADAITRLSELGVATVYEASGREGLIDIPLVQIIPESRVAGPVRTVLCGQDDNLMVHAVIEQIQPAHLGHHQVKQDHVGLLLNRHFHGLGAVIHHDWLVSGCQEDGLQEVGRAFVVVNNQKLFDPMFLQHRLFRWT